MKGFNVPHDKFNLVIIGTGGNGGKFIQLASTLIYSFTSTLIGKKKISVTIVDGDVFEAKNKFNQPCIDRDIGRYKSQVFAERYSTPSNVLINYKTAFLRDEEEIWELLSKDEDTLNVIFGCVDNDRSRCMIYNVFNESKNLIWIDSGNTKTSGQVVMGVRAYNMTVVPSVADVYPGVLNAMNDDIDEKLINTTGCSRTEPTNVKTIGQNYITNCFAATIMLGYLNSILQGDEIVTHHVNFNTQFLNCKPEYIQVHNEAI